MLVARCSLTWLTVGRDWLPTMAPINSASGANVRMLELMYDRPAVRLLQHAGAIRLVDIVRLDQLSRPLCFSLALASSRSRRMPSFAGPPPAVPSGPGIPGMLSVEPWWRAMTRHRSSSLGARVAQVPVWACALSASRLQGNNPLTEAAAGTGAKGLVAAAVPGGGHGRGALRLDDHPPDRAGHAGRLRTAWRPDTHPEGMLRGHAYWVRR